LNKYVQFDASSGSVKLALYGRPCLAKDAGIAPKGTGSHRIVMTSDAGPFSGPRRLPLGGRPVYPKHAAGSGGEKMTENLRSTPIRFKAAVLAIDRSMILRLPEKASEQLPSRGQVAVTGTINGHAFQTVIEPDGLFGHWIKVDEKLQKTAALETGAEATVEMAATKAWPEPSVPADLRAALAAAPTKIQDLWNEITPMARWEWVRWVNETRNSDTRKTPRRGHDLENEQRQTTALLLRPRRVH